MATSSAVCLEDAQKLLEKLCQNCRKVHQNIPVGMDGRISGFWVDEFPSLPRFKVSSRQGCTFCGYLRETILSKRTIQFIETHYSINATDFGMPADRGNYQVRMDAEDLFYWF